MQQHNYYVYILTNRNHRVLYTGMTNDLIRRVQEHRTQQTKGFTSRYRVTKLVYYERFSRVEEAIAQEKQLKAGTRQKKLDRIHDMNPNWDDLFPLLLS